IVLDDDLGYGRLLERTFREHGEYEVSVTTGAAQCMEELERGPCELLICDLRLPEGDGLQVLEDARRMRPGLPVVMLSAYADIPTAVRAIQKGAMDFWEKMTDTEELVTQACSLLENLDPSAGDGGSLRPAEKQVLELILQGLSNKEIADRLCRSIRTVETHRYRAMKKLGARNLTQLVRRATQNELAGRRASDGDGDA
ncbi:MAG: response regulator transcription factor, partial [Sedimentisphaerales bacterium]|nr:response regulator transcription factor [Sedimentisphaerales bacterium]